MTSGPAAISTPRQVSVATFRESIERHARYSLAQAWETLSPRQVLECVSLAVRDLMIDRRLETERRYHQADAKHLYYLSIEYLLGRLLSSNLINLGIYDLCRATLRQMGIALEDVEDAERDAALGNGGLGRLAACFLDSLATLDMPGYAYGINYEYGLFQQQIDDGYQKEKPAAPPRGSIRPHHSLPAGAGRLAGIRIWCLPHQQQRGRRPVFS